MGPLWTTGRANVAGTADLARPMRIVASEYLGAGAVGAVGPVGVPNVWDPKENPGRLGVVGAAIVSM